MKLPFLTFLGTIHGELVEQMRRPGGRATEARKVSSAGRLSSSHYSTSWSFSHISYGIAVCKGYTNVGLLLW